MDNGVIIGADVSSAKSDLEKNNRYERKISLNSDLGARIRSKDHKTDIKELEGRSKKSITRDDPLSNPLKTDADLIIEMYQVVDTSEESELSKKYNIKKGYKPEENGYNGFFKGDILPVFYELSPKIIEVVQEGKFTMKFVGSLCEKFSELATNPEYSYKLQMLFRRIVSSEEMLKEFCLNVKDYLNQVNLAQTEDDRRAVEENLRLFVYNTIVPPYQRNGEGSCFVTSILMNIWHNDPIGYMQLIRGVVDKDEVNFSFISKKTSKPIDVRIYGVKDGNLDKVYQKLLSAFALLALRRGNFENITTRILKSKLLKKAEELGIPKPHRSNIVEALFVQGIVCNHGDWQLPVCMYLNDLEDRAIVIERVIEIIRHALEATNIKLIEQDKKLTEMCNEISNSVLDLIELRNGEDVSEDDLSDVVGEQAEKFLLSFKEYCRIINNLCDNGVLSPEVRYTPVCTNQDIADMRGQILDNIQKNVKKALSDGSSAGSTTLPLEIDDELAEKIDELSKYAIDGVRQSGGPSINILKELFKGVGYKEVSIAIKKPAKKFSFDMIFDLDADSTSKSEHPTIRECKFLIEEFRPILDVLERATPGDFVLVHYNIAGGSHVFNFRADKYDAGNMKIGEWVEIGHLNYWEASQKNEAVFMKKVDENTIQLVLSDGTPINVEDITELHVYQRDA